MNTIGCSNYEQNGKLRAYATSFPIFFVVCRNGLDFSFIQS